MQHFLLIDAKTESGPVEDMAHSKHSLSASQMDPQCSVSVSDLQLCLGLQGQEQQYPPFDIGQRHQDSGTNTSFSISSTPALWSSRPGEAMASFSNSSASSALCYCSNCAQSGDSRWQYSDDDYTSPSAVALGMHSHIPGKNVLDDSLLITRMPSHGLSTSMPAEKLRHLADHMQVTDSINLNARPVSHSVYFPKANPFTHPTSQSESLELDLSGDLRFSPLNSASNLFQQSSTSPLSELDTSHNPMNSKFNYFLAFNDGQQSMSHIQPDASLMDQRLDDSGTVCTEEEPVNDNGKLKCWTDVAESYMEPSTSTFQAQSIIAPLSDNIKKRNGSSSSKLSHSGSPECNVVTEETSSSNSVISATSGYSSSRSVQNANTPGRQAFSQQPLLSTPSHRIRQSPSLPLHIGTGTTAETLQRNYDFSQRGRHAASANEIHSTPSLSTPTTRSKYSAPDLPFLATPTQWTSTQTPPVAATKMPRPFSCPERFLPPGDPAPLRVNTVDDWESLKVLLPTQFQRFFPQHPVAAQRLPSVPWGIHSDEQSDGRKRRDSDNVCPTCFKLLDGEEGMAQSLCDCSPVRSSTSSSKSVFTEPRAGHSQISLFDDLMEFSRRDVGSDSPMQVVINLKHKQELVTAVKAAAVGLLGLAGFRGMQKEKEPVKQQHSESLSRMMIQQFNSALLRLLEDGMHRGYTAWSVLVNSSTSTKKRRNSNKTTISMEIRVKEIIKAIESSPDIHTDQQCFYLFITELLRSGELKEWLKWRIEQPDTSAHLRKCYAMDGFVFLASSITKDLWEDLLDTLSCLKCASSPRKPLESPSVPKIQPSIGSPRSVASPRDTSMTTSSSVKRLAEKLGLVHKKEADSEQRRFSLLPSYPTQIYVPSRKKGQKPQEPDPIEPKPETSVDYAAQPHLSMHMKTRWSEWHLSKLAESTDTQDGFHETGLGNEKLRAPAAVGIGRTKSPSMFDIRSFIR